MPETLSPRSLQPVVEALYAETRGPEFDSRVIDGQREFPSRSVVGELVEALRSVLFPGYFGPSELTGEATRFHIGATLDRTLHRLREQVKRGLCSICEEKEPSRCAECDRHAAAIAHEFVARLPKVRALLGGDARAAFEGDPAARSADEAIFCYPGLHAIISHRLAHELHTLGVPLLPRMIAEQAHSLTGIDIHPGARIGARFFIDHGTGVVIGETCVIGERVRLYQGVTLGAKSLPLDEAGPSLRGVSRHPIVEDDVVIYSNATILGRVTIGRGSTIGGNVWLTRSVPPGSFVSQTALKTERFEGGGGI